VSLTFHKTDTHCLLRLRQTWHWQQRLSEVVLLVQPEAVLKWHQELVLNYFKANPEDKTKHSPSSSSHRELF
jgi:hypothetical protein